MQLFLFYNRPLIVTRDCLQMRGLPQTVEHIMKDWLSNRQTNLPSSTHDLSRVLFFKRGPTCWEYEYQARYIYLTHEKPAKSPTPRGQRRTLGGFFRNCPALGFAIVIASNRKKPFVGKCFRILQCDMLTLCVRWLNNSAGQQQMFAHLGEQFIRKRGD